MNDDDTHWWEHAKADHVGPAIDYENTTRAKIRLLVQTDLTPVPVLPLAEPASDTIKSWSDLGFAYLNGMLTRDLPVRAFTTTFLIVSNNRWIKLIEEHTTRINEHALLHPFSRPLDDHFMNVVCDPNYEKFWLEGVINIAIVDVTLHKRVSVATLKKYTRLFAANQRTENVLKNKAGLACDLVPPGDLGLFRELIGGTTPVPTTGGAP